MIKIKLTGKDGREWTKLVDTPTAHILQQRPTIVGAVKCEIFVEKPTEKPKPTVVEQEKQPEKEIDELLTQYGEAEYKGDSELAKELLKSDEPKNAIPVIEMMLKYKPNPYWKGKLNKLK